MKAVSLYSDPKGRTELEKALSLRSDITLCRSFSQFPDLETLTRALRAWAPEIILLDITHPAIEIVNTHLATDFPQIRRVAIHPSQHPEVFRRVLHMGMRELINPPFKPNMLGPVLDRLISDIEQHPVQHPQTCRVSAFMPAKAGSGASTLAAHATWATATNPEARILLADFDRYSGVTGFQFNVQSDYTVGDALVNSVALDEESWRRLIKPVDNIDLLLSRPGEFSEVATERYVGPLLQFAQRNYTTIHADLPDTLDPHTLAVLHQADQIFLVATPELPSLRLARVKSDTLRKLDLEGRTRLVLNRMTNRLGLSLKEIETTVGMEVFATFPCDYPGVSLSLHKAKPAPRIMKEMEEFLVKSGMPFKKPVARVSFLERFSLPMALSFRDSSILSR
jgi:MinD-like ATPase involved in chromosome partitioning or flagellar assembly